MKRPTICYEFARSICKLRDSWQIAGLLRELADIGMLEPGMIVRVAPLATSVQLEW